MANTPYMNLALPTVSVTTGPAWASALNAVLQGVDAHNHTPGSGALVPSTGIGINADLPANGFNLTTARTIRFADQTNPISMPSDVGCLYLASGNLFFNSGAGAAVQLTSGSSIAGTPGSISGLVSPAAVTYTSIDTTFRFTSAANTNASIDVGILRIRQQIANANAVALQSPNSLVAAYSITLLPALPAGQRILTIDNLGAMSTWNVDGTTITVNAGVLDAIGATALAANTSVVLKGNRSAADTGADVVSNGSTTRSAGLIHDFQNNGTSKVAVRQDGAVVATPANSSVVLVGNRLSADASASVISDNLVTRSAGVIHSFNNNNAPKAAVGFNGVIHAPNAVNVVQLSSDFSVPTDGTYYTFAFGFPAAVSVPYLFFGHLRIGGPDGVPFKIETAFPPGSGTGFVYQLDGGTTPTSGVLSAFTPIRSVAAGGNLIGNGAGTLYTFDINLFADFSLSGFFTNGATPGTFQFLVATGTPGQVVTVRSGSWIAWMRTGGGFD